MAERTRKHPPILAVILLAVVIVGGIIWWIVASTQGGEARIWGTVEADEYQVSALTSGQVKELAVAEGDTVKAGDPLLQLDDTAANLSLEQAKQSVVVAQAGVEQAKDEPQADRQVAAAKLKQAEAAVKLAQLQVDYTTVTASVDGRVNAILTNVGANAVPGKNLVTLLDVESSFLRAYVPQNKLANLQVGGEAKIVLTAADAQLLDPTASASAQELIGKISYIAAEAEFTPTTVQTSEQQAKQVYEVRIDLSSTSVSSALRPGMSLEVRF